MILSILFFLYGVIVFNLYLLQVKQQSFFTSLGEKQYNVSVTTLPERANIYDKNGTAVAINKDSYSAFLLPKELQYPQETNQFLKQYFPQAQQRLKKTTDKNFMFIERRLTLKQKEQIENANLPDIHILQEPSRFYPYKSLSTVIGVTDIDNQGTIALEQQYNMLLSGVPTVHTLKKDARNNHFYFEKELKFEGKPGTSIKLTIDADLQFKVSDVLEECINNFEAKEGAILIMDPDNGRIESMVSYPYFDPNDMQNLNMQHTKNRPVSQAFETGSVIKVFSALAALEEEVTTLDEIIDCENTKETKIDGIRVRTVLPDDQISFLKVIQRSNNIGTVKVVKRLNDLLYDYYKLVGFGDKTSLDFPGEQKGYVNHPNNWSAYSIYSLSYGYEITTTLIQLARAMSLIYNGGYLVSPQLILSPQQPIEKIGPLVSSKALEDLQTILEASVVEGTGKRARISGYKVTGKTGTANVIEDGQYNEAKNLYTFIGCVEKESYKRVIVAYIKESKRKTYSSVIAAPLFKKTAEAILLHDHIIS